MEETIHQITYLGEPEWRAAAERHRECVEGWVAAHRTRAGAGRAHPVFDFLFDYYSFRGASLLRWSPGAGVVLRGARSDSFAGAEAFEAVRDGMVLPFETFPRHREPYLAWAIRYLEQTSARAPSFRCYGLHEWAFLSDGDPRYRSTPLRLSRDEIFEVVQEHGLRCTHYDAYRFLPAAMAAANRYSLRRDTTAEFDQCGCVHVNMDLYRFAYKIAPFTSSAVTADAFELAAAAREVDMRASPYDLREFGMAPIRIETEEGRGEYITAQRAIAERGLGIRSRLLREYRRLQECRSGNLEGAAPSAPLDPTGDFAT